MLECCYRRNWMSYEGIFSNACKEELKTHKIVLSIISVNVGEAVLAIFCFDKKGATGGMLNPRVYDYINLSVAGALLASTLLRSNVKFQDPREKGVCSYEFFMVAMVVQTVMYGIVFFQTQDQTDFDRKLIYGASLAMVSTSILLTALKHCKASTPLRRPSDLEEALFLEHRGNVEIPKF